LLPVIGLTAFVLGCVMLWTSVTHPLVGGALVAAGAAVAGWWQARRGWSAALEKIIGQTLRIGEGVQIPLAVQGIPGTLQPLITAVNTLSARLQHIFATESERAEKLRQEALTDPLSQLANRRGFLLAYANQFEYQRDVNGGMMIMLVVDHLADFNGLEGFAAGDALIVAVTGAMQAALPANAVTGRLGGGTFIAVIRSASASKSAALASDLVDSVRAMLAQRYPALLNCHAGAVLFEGQAPAAGALLSNADLALTVARAHRQPVEVVMHRNDAASPMGAGAWRDALQSALSGQGIRLAMQPVVDLSDSRWLQAELFTRLALPDGSEAAARQFMPMAARHQLVAAFDRHVIATLSAYATLPAEIPDGARLVVNLGAQSLDSPDLVRALEALVVRPALKGRLAFEFAEVALVSHETELARLIPLFEAVDAHWGIDHFGIEPQWLEHLVQWRPDYIKLAGNYLNNLREQESGRFCISAVVRTADTLGIAVYASMVEDPQLLPVLAECGVRGAQGYALRAPQPLSAA
jgi:diguanylate cyclase (GGDEF)-like protein